MISWHISKIPSNNLCFYKDGKKLFVTIFVVGGPHKGGQGNWDVWAGGQGVRR